MGVASTPHFDSIDIRINDVLKMSGHSRAISSGTASSRAYSLGNIEDDRCEAVFVEVYFLVVWDLSDSTAIVSFRDRKEILDTAHLMSVNVDGMSTIRAPPKSGVLRNVVILELCA